eukprot:582843-Prymnesium_polylepis.1
MPSPADILPKLQAALREQDPSKLDLVEEGGAAAVALAVLALGRGVGSLLSSDEGDEEGEVVAAAAESPAEEAERRRKFLGIADESYDAVTRVFPAVDPTTYSGGIAPPGAAPPAAPPAATSQRSAPEIFFAGLLNLEASPTG